MTFCLGIKCAEGLIAIADTRITSGSEVSIGKKIAVHQGDGTSMFVLTSGLRSVRDKALTYFEERMQLSAGELSRSYEAVNTLADVIRRVYNEDNDWLIRAGLHFDLHCLVGCQLPQDEAPHLFLVYPQGNWVEVTEGTPYLIIGDTRYGKPVLDLALRYEATLEQALRMALLAFHSTMTSATDVGPPVDVAAYANYSHEIRVQRFSETDIQPLATYWQESINQVIDQAGDPVSPLAAALGLWQPDT